MSASTNKHQAEFSTRTIRMGTFWLLSALLLPTILWLAGCAGQKTTAVEKPASIPAEMALLRTDISLRPLSTLNSARDDFGVTMPLDTSLVFFTSNRIGATGAHSIFWSYWANSQWKLPELAVEINNEQSNGMPSITPNGESMFFTGCDYGFGDCDLYRVESGIRGKVNKQTTPWTIPRNLGILVNTLYWDSQPSLSADGSVMFFSSDRPGGYGGRDIWVCLRGQDGQWTEPFNAGSTINTVFDEITPSITPDCRTLFFASNGHPGIGGFDLFFIELDPEAGLTPISSALNMGRPLNSTTDDIALTVSPDGRRAFFSSNRSGGLGGYDIYQLNQPPVEIDPVAIVHGVVQDENGKPAFAQIEVNNLTNGNVIGTFQTNPETGRYAVVVRKSGSFAITAQASDRLFSSVRVEVPGDISENTYYATEHTLQPIGEPVRLLLFFDPGSNILRRESIVDLNRVIAFMKANPDIRIEIGGHTDNIGDPETNKRISLERAESVKAFLTGNRINADRIEVKGYGEERPIATNNTEEGRSQNRRVEMRVE